MMLRLVSPLAIVALVGILSDAAHADAPYVGKWAAADLSCKDESIELEDRALHGMENMCRFVKIDRNDARRYSVDATCQGEGHREEHRRFVIDVIDANAIVMTYANGRPILYRRCPR
ncbi:hypothetical protein [Filomicrobium sp.]|uniref:hypothetical protein n=1 Tax=Filomicrobium sp. TaxID=2024831 RepID=UPI00258B144A|nr:hypothetical protein [Filomicrobium sp.]MCV0370312.1 hypothetical protein [Filomicrobium sp.]